MDEGLHRYQTQDVVGPQVQGQEWGGCKSHAEGVGGAGGWWAIINPTIRHHHPPSGNYFRICDFQDSGILSWYSTDYDDDDACFFFGWVQQYQSKLR